MVTFRYDAGNSEPVELEPVDHEFEYVAAGGYWAIKVEETDDGDLVKWIPNERVYEIEGLRPKISHRRPDR